MYRVTTWVYLPCKGNPTLVSDVDHLIASDAGNLTLVSDADPIASDASTHTLVSDVDHLIASDAGNLTLVSDADPIASDASTHPSVSDVDHLTASGIGDLGVTDVSTKKQAPPSKKKRPDAAQTHTKQTASGGKVPNGFPQCRRRESETAATSQARDWPALPPPQQQAAHASSEEERTRRYRSAPSSTEAAAANDIFALCHCRIFARAFVLQICKVREREVCDVL
ncbi:hypothetical protein QAD02_008699 [Eretmocerus hayati]|uniref:Uncharacterized protein n=1 Tax=Eretmocerus hayati TaxID=131215 RepID=A0ACC2N7A0_9HYME|nr:hypothetical protein QAD02_008699 [Eretmocerus hayati]